jgi:2-phosphoglycerate kinase
VTDPPRVIFGAYVRNVLRNILEQQASSLIMSVVESWWAAKGETMPTGQWRLVLEGVSVVLEPPAPDGSPSNGAVR